MATLAAAARCAATNNQQSPPSSTTILKSCHDELHQWSMHGQPNRTRENIITSLGNFYETLATEQGAFKSANDISQLLMDCALLWKAMDDRRFDAGCTLGQFLGKSMQALEKSCPDVAADGFALFKTEIVRYTDEYCYNNKLSQLTGDEITCLRRAANGVPGYPNRGNRRQAANQGVQTQEMK